MDWSSGCRRIHQVLDDAAEVGTNALDDAEDAEVVTKHSRRWWGCYYCDMQVLWSGVCNHRWYGRARTAPTEHTMGRMWRDTEEVDTIGCWNGLRATNATGCMILGRNWESTCARITQWFFLLVLPSFPLHILLCIFYDACKSLDGLKYTYTYIHTFSR